MCDTGNTTTTVFPPEHAFLITELCKVFLQARLSLSLSPGTVLALSCFLGLAGPGRTDPDPSFSCSPTEMPSGWCEWLPQQRPGDLQPAGTKVTPPQRFALSLPSFHQPAGELFILYNLRGTNLLHKHPPLPPQKKLHTQFTDIITCNEKINVSAWTAKINSSQMSSDIAGMRLLYGRGRWNQL